LTEKPCTVTKAREYFRAPALSPDLNISPAAELSVVAPTFKERGNVAELVRRLDAALTGIAWEVIFVDDNSPDGTAAAVKEIAARDTRVRCLKRVGRRGLAEPASKAFCPAPRPMSR